jgi:hypothetical protein
MIRVTSERFLYEHPRAFCCQLDHSPHRIYMDEGIEKDNTSGGGGLPTLPGLNLSTIQPSRRGFYRIHVCEGEDNWTIYIDARVPVQ